MNVAFFPDLFALAILIVILAMVRRQHSDARADAWLLGLSFTLVESIAHTFYAPTGVPDRVLHVIVLDCYVLAGWCSTGRPATSGWSTARGCFTSSLNGLALLTLTTIYGLNLRYAGVYIPAIVVGMLIGVGSSIFLRRNWRYAVGYACGWTAIGLVIVQHDFRAAVYWSLGCVYAIAALNFQRRLETAQHGQTGNCDRILDLGAVLFHASVGDGPLCVPRRHRVARVEHAEVADLHWHDPDDAGGAGIEQRVAGAAR